MTTINDMIGAVGVSLNAEFGDDYTIYSEPIEQNAGEGLGIAPIGHVVNVKGVSGVAVNVLTNVTFDSGYSWDNLGAKFREVVAGYLLELRKTWADTQNIVVRISQIESRILAIDGVLDIKNTAINGVAENLVLGEFEVPIYGGVASE